MKTNLSFYEMGVAQAERDIEEISTGETSKNRPEIDSEIKPFTTKVHFHVIESLDLVASSIGISRNTLITKMIDQFLGQVFTEYNGAYHSRFDAFVSDDISHDAFVSRCLTKLLENSEVSQQARDYLSSCVVGFMMENH